MKKILVIGASGSLGQKICQSLISFFEEDVHLYIGDYKEERGKLIAAKYKRANHVSADVHSEESIQKAISGDIDCVVVAVNQKKPIVQLQCSIKGIPCVDVTGSAEFSKQTESSLPKNCAVSVCMVGMFPGLSGVLVKESLNHLTSAAQISVALLQSVNATVGVTGVVDMLHVLSSGSKEFKNKKKFLIGGKNYTLREIRYDESDILQSKLQLSLITYWTGWRYKIFTSLMFFVARYKLCTTLITQLIKRLHLKRLGLNHPKISEKVALSIEAVEDKEQHSCKKVIQLEAYSD